MEELLEKISEQASELLKSDMNNIRSSFVIFDDKLYILDGKNYLVYDTELKEVKNDSP